nr:MAG TPA: hypothetical protein [Bacteriophage sp.]
MEQEQTPQIDEAAMVGTANDIIKGRSTEIEIGGKRWKLRRISNAQAAKIGEYAQEARQIQAEQKREGLSERKQKRLYKRFRQIPAKIAARYILGLRRCWIPFATAYMWRRLWFASEELSMTININKTLQREEESFFTANLEVISYLLALSMKQVGDVAKQWLERKESAENMLDEDALPKKEEDSK